jgi:hypothetical protein
MDFRAISGFAVVPKPTEIQHRDADAKKWKSHELVLEHRISLRFMFKIFALNPFFVNSTTRLSMGSPFELP